MSISNDSDPDLELRVRVETDDSLAYELRRQEPRGEQPRIRSFRSSPLLGRLDSFLALFWRDLEEAYGSEEKKGELAERRLIAKGAALAEAIFPADLRESLALESGRLASLLILSDEPRIPWEVAWIFKDGSNPSQGFFLGEAFAIGRWWPGRPEIRVLPFRNVALVVAGGSALPESEEERTVVLGLATRDRQVMEVPPDLLKVVEELERGGRDGWHFVGHGSAKGEDAGRWALELNADESLRSEDVRSLDRNAGAPFIFLNTCTSGRLGFSLAGTAGWAERLVNLGAGAFLGPQWRVRDRAASRFAQLFYQRFRQGVPIGEAVRRAREDLGAADRAARLSYALFAPPGAVCSWPDGVAEGGNSIEAPNASQRRRPGSKDFLTTVSRNSDRARRSLEPYLLPRIPRREVELKYLPAIRESVKHRRSRVIPILGSAGFGKSTLLGEIYDALRSEAISWIALVDSAELSLSAPADLYISLCRSLCGDEVTGDALFATLSRQGPGVLLIDTLDLVLSPTVVPHLQRLLFGLEETSTTVVFTCRDVDYQLLLEPPGMRLPQIADRIDRYFVPAFTPSEVALVAQAFVDASHLRETLVGDAFVERLLSLSADSRSLRAITSNPLLLAMLCEVFGQEGDLPQDLTVSELYERYWDEKVARSRTQGPGDPVVIEKPRLCLRIAQHLTEEWSELAQDWIAEPDLGIEGSTAVAQARAELLSEGVLKPLGNDRLRFFHQTFLEYVMARWLATRSGAAALEKILGSIRGEENAALHWWPVLRQLLVMVEPEVFGAIVGRLPLESLVAFRTVSFATVARAEPQRWSELLQVALDLGEEYQKTLCIAAENASARFLPETWSNLEALIGSGTRSVAISATATVATLLAREKGTVAKRLCRVMDALLARTGDPRDYPDFLGQLLRTCLPSLKVATDPAVFELLQARYPSFASKGKGLIIDLFRSATIEEELRAQFVRFLFTQPREKHLPTDALVALIEKTLRAEILGDNVTTEDRLEILHRPVPKGWVSVYSRAAARIFVTDPRMILAVTKSHFSLEASSLHRSSGVLEEMADLGRANEICRALAELPHETLPVGRISSLATLSRKLAQRAEIGPRQELARWLQPLALARPGEALQVFAPLADACDETWSELVAALWAALERGDDRLAERAFDDIPEVSRARLEPEIKRLVDRYPGRASLQQMLVAIYAPQEALTEAVPRLAELALSHAKAVALAASLALARVVNEGARPAFGEIFPLAQSKFPGVRDHLMDAVITLQEAGCSFSESDLVDLCQRLSSETNAPTVQKLCKVVGAWLRVERRMVLPVTGWVVGLSRRIESGDLGPATAGALVRILKVMAQLEDPQVSSLLQEAAHRMLRGIQSLNRLSVGESELTDLLAALARIDQGFLAHLVDDGPNLPGRNVRALAFAIRRVEGAGSPLLSLMLSSEWCPPYTRKSILEFRGV